MIMRLNPPSILTRWAVLPLAIWLYTAPAALAQDYGAPTAPPAQGFQLSSVSGYVIYYSKSVPLTAGLQPISGNLPSDVGAGASARLGWSRFRERTDIVFTYTPSYSGRARYSGVDAFNQASSVNIMRKITPRLTLTVSGAVDYSSIEQFLFSPTAFGSVVAVPASFEDLSGAVLAGRFTNPLLAAAVTAAPLANSPALNLLYGSRTFTSAAQTSLSYSYSPRLSFATYASASRNQHVSDTLNIAGRNDHLIPSTTSGSVGVSFSYALSPVTQLGGSITGSRVSSSLLADRFTTTSLGTLGRTLARRWLVQVHGGVGIISPIRVVGGPVNLSMRSLPVVGGTVGLRNFSHSILGTYERTAGDSYGIGATSTSSATVSWRWSRPGRPWWVESGVTWEQLQGSALSEMSGWRTTSGFGRAVGSHATLLTEYVYLRYSGRQIGNGSFSESAVRVSMAWNKQPRPTR